MAKKRTKPSSRKKKTGGKAEQTSYAGLKEEAILILSFLFSLLLFLSNLGFCGIVGEALSQGMLFVFGSVSVTILWCLGRFHLFVFCIYF